MSRRQFVRIGLACLTASAVMLQSCVPAQTAAPPPVTTQVPSTTRAATAAPASTATSTAAASTPTASAPTVTTSPALASTATAAPTKRAPQTACDHPYLPIRSGASWNYSSPNGTVTWQVAAVTGDAISATAGIRLGAGAGVAGTTIQWHCSADGLVSYDAADQLAADTVHNTGVSITNTTGVALLPAAQLSVGMTWDMAFTVTYTVLNGGQKLPYRNQYWNHYTLTVSEPLQVGDQTYDALRVEAVTTSTVTGGGFTPRTFHTATKWWYVRDVGLVSYQTMSLGGQTALYKLVNYKLP